MRRSELISLCCFLFSGCNITCGGHKPDSDDKVHASYSQLTPEKFGEYLFEFQSELPKGTGKFYDLIPEKETKISIQVRAVLRHIGQFAEKLDLILCRNLERIVANHIAEFTMVYESIDFRTSFPNDPKVFDLLNGLVANVIGFVVSPEKYDRESDIAYFWSSPKYDTYIRTAFKNIWGRLEGDRTDPFIFCILTQFGVESPRVDAKYKSFSYGVLEAMQTSEDVNKFFLDMNASSEKKSAATLALDN